MGPYGKDYRYRVSNLIYCMGICLACFIRREHPLLQEGRINIDEALRFAYVEKFSLNKRQGLCRKNCCTEYSRDTTKAGKGRTD